MAVIKISTQNPNDGTTTFDKVRFYEADDSSGTNSSLLATVSIDTSNRYQIDPGTTSYSYTSGSTLKYYATRYYNSVSLIQSDFTTWTIGGEDRWDTMFKQDLGDTSSEVWSAADRVNFKKWALDALFPDLFKEVTDTSLTLDNDTTPVYTYTVPFGIFEISEVGIGDIQNDSSLFKIVHPNNWTMENSVLHFKNLSNLTDAATIRLIAHAKYFEVGEVPDRFDGFVLHHLKMSAYLNLADDFPRFNKWGRMQEGTKVSFENLRVHAREFERKFVEGKAEVRNTMFPSLL